MIRHHRDPLAAIALVGMLGLTACTDDKDADAAPSNTTVSDRAAAGATGDAVDCDGTPGATVTVEIPDFEFDPDAIQVHTCDVVVWSNQHTQSHTSTGNGDVSWSTGNITVGAESDPVVFDTPGEFAYMCALHPFMKGTVEVS